MSADTAEHTDPHDRPPVPELTVFPGIQPFHLQGAPVRGRLVRLGPLADAIVGRHAHDPRVGSLLAEALALTAGLAASLKFEGSFQLQAKGDGAVPLLLADCTEAGALRGYVRADSERVSARSADDGNSAGALLGQGYLAFTCDRGPDRERYQGIVAITGDSLAEMTHHYFLTSEQLRCVVRIAAQRTDGGWRAAALILEKIPEEGGLNGAGIANPQAADDADDRWRAVQALASTATDAELLDETEPPGRLLDRLFRLEGAVMDRPRALSYGCRCTRSRLSGILAGFPAEDLDDMVVDQGAIVMTCEFCNYDFRFDRSEFG